VSGEYEAGDVNTVASDHVGSDADGPDYGPGDVNDRRGPASGPTTETANRAEASTALGVLTYLARSLADDPDAVVVETERRRGSVVLRVHVAPGDMGRVIGRRGRTAQAIRTLLAAAGARDGTSVVVDIVDD